MSRCVDPLGCRVQPASLIAFALVVVLAGIPGSAVAQQRPTDADIDAANAAAENLRKAGDYAGAIQGFQRTVELTRQVYGPEHWMVAAYARNLAMAYIADEQYDKAEPVLRDATARIHRAWNDGDPGDTVLAGTYEINAQYNYELGRNQLAADFREDALALYLRRAPEYEQVAQVHINLAQTYSRMGRHADALAQAELGLAHRVARHRPNSAALWKARQVQAYVFQMAGRFAEAEPIFRAYLEDDLQAYGKDSAPYSMADLALVQMQLGQFAEADDLLTRRTAWTAKHHGAGTRAAAEPAMWLATVKAYAGDKKSAVDLTHRSLPVLRSHFLRVAAGIAEGEQFTYLQDFTGKTLSDALSIAWLNRDDPATVEKSAEWVLNVKNLLFEVMAERQLLARDGRFPEVGVTAESLRVARRDLANHLGAGPNKGEEDAWWQRRDELVALEEQLSRELVRVGGHARLSPQWVSLTDVRSAISAGEVLIEIKKVELRDFTDKGGPNGLLKVEPRYLAWVIPPTGGGKVKLIDLGPAAAVDEGAAKLVLNVRTFGGEVLSQAENQLRWDLDDGKITPAEFAARVAALEKELQAAQPKLEAAFPADALALSKLIVRPVIAAAGGSKAWVVSPDADLWLVPWAALATADGKWLVESVGVRQAVTGRDLLPTRPADRKAQTAPLVVADPNYDRGITGPADRGSNDGRLKGTRREAADIGPYLQTFAQVAPVVKLDDDAGEEAVKASRSPKVLVLATHAGFRPIDPAEVQPGFSHPSENPMLRSRLIFAGSNLKRRPADAGEDGKLYGVEVYGLDLRDTELAYLSACQTALGDVHSGQSAAGLRQAFQLAGVRSVVATLWSVDDAAAAEFSKRYFARLAAKDSPAAALTTATREQLTAQKKSGQAHPYYWASHTLTERGR